MSFTDEWYDVTLWLGEEDIDRLDRLANGAGVHRSAFVRDLLRYYEEALNALGKSMFDGDGRAETIIEVVKELMPGYAAGECRDDIEEE